MAALPQHFAPAMPWPLPTHWPLQANEVTEGRARQRGGRFGYMQRSLQHLQDASHADCWKGLHLCGWPSSSLTFVAQTLVVVGFAVGRAGAADGVGRARAVQVGAAGGAKHALALGHALIVAAVGVWARKRRQQGRKSSDTVGGTNGAWRVQQ